MRRLHLGVAGILGMGFAWLTWSLGSTPAANADAPDGPADLDFRHPLSSPQSVALFESSGLSTDEFLAAVEFSVGAEYLDDGRVIDRSGVRWAEATPGTDVVDHEPAPPQEPVVHPDLRDQLALPQNEQPQALELWIRLRASEWDRGDDPTQARWKALIEGRISTVADERDVRTESMARRNAAGEAALDALVDDLAARGAEIVETLPRSGQVRALVAPADVVPLLSDRRIAAIEIYEEAVDDTYGHWQSITTKGMTGYNFEDVLQTYQFYYATTLGHATNYYGDGAIALIEDSGANIFIDHPGFKDGSGAGRVFNCANTTPPWCTLADPAVGGRHSTGVASVLVGDLTRSQDSSVTASQARRERSGIARRAGVLGLPSNLGWVESQLSNFNDVYITNSSFHVNTDVNCLGQTAWSAGYNSLYEDGFAMFKSASNEGSTDTTDCNVGNPGSAIGVFTVGAFNGGDAAAEAIDVDQSRGGTSTEGGGRTIIALASPTSFYFAYPHYDRPIATSTVLSPYYVLSGGTYYYGVDFDWDDPAVVPGTMPDTSGATPTASGSANVFSEWFRDIYGNMVDDPGTLYTNMLLMGDRTLQEGSKSDTLYDNLWGAGKLRLRRFDPEGLDNPAGWNTGSVCVGAGQNVDVSISSVITSDVDVIKGVTWWYDRRHQDGITGGDGIAHDELTLALQRSTSGSVWTTVEHDTSDDNKQRVFSDNSSAGYSHWRMRIYSQDVTADNEGCGQNAMRVYWAWMYEDSDRESAEYLDSVRPE